MLKNEGILIIFSTYNRAFLYFMADVKTKPTGESVHAFIASLDDAQKRKDCTTLIKLMKEVTGEPPKMWGSMIGFGHYHYVYESGREGDTFVTGFAPRKQNLTLYIMGGFTRHDDLLEKLGKFKIAKACLYIKKLDDVDSSVLKTLIKRSVQECQGSTKC
jgi:hypothetical protein